MSTCSPPGCWASSCSTAYFFPCKWASMHSHLHSQCMHIIFSTLYVECLCTCRPLELECLPVPCLGAGRLLATLHPLSPARLAAAAGQPAVLPGLFWAQPVPETWPPAEQAGATPDFGEWPLMFPLKKE
eukprot:scaffold43933_cov19-Tisochrysis_lutea.AAC.1